MFFRFAKAVPEDKLDWSPLENGRSVLSMCREIAMTPSWTMYAFTDIRDKWTEADRDEQQRLMESFKTVDQCEQEYKQRFAEVEKLYLSFSDEDLKKTRWLPYNGGRDHTYLEMMDYPRWNCTWHTGQVAYIQSLYGDKEHY